ncbi:MAG: hypothetical protein EOM14_02450 [Clostridia bacterium]|nr:hypothetical protein [Clostridia bacterium]
MNGQLQFRFISSPLYDYVIAMMVIPRASKTITNCTAYLLENRGHISVLAEEEKQKIIAFLL